MKNKIFPILAFKDNYIWAWQDDMRKTAWVVDPGDAAPVVDYLAREGLALAGILLTHHHHDHTGGIQELLKHWPYTQIIGSHNSPIKEITQRVGEGDEVDCRRFQFKVIEIPGHTLDHIAYVNEETLFCGDTLFSAGCGRVFEGTPAQMYHSLTKLLSLPNDIQVYCGHEYTEANLNFARLVEPNNPAILAKLEEVLDLRSAHLPSLPSVLGREKRFNPFLRCTRPEVAKAAEIRVGHALKTPEEVFAVIRDWKNKL